LNNEVQLPAIQRVNCKLWWPSNLTAKELELVVHIGRSRVQIPEPAKSTQRYKWFTTASTSTRSSVTLPLWRGDGHR